MRICVVLWVFALSCFKITYGDRILTSSDLKDFKKILRTRLNIIVLFRKDAKSGKDWNTLFTAVADTLDGKATFLNINCGDSKKLCKRLKVEPTPVILHHYMNGQFHKVYDRLQTAKSLTHFLLHPTEEIPWVEDPSARSVHHLANPKDLTQMIADKRPILIMFYAPWCTHCKNMKPEFAAAATELSDKYILAGMDVESAENSEVKYRFNITHFPTVYYIKDGKMQFEYKGKNTKEEIVSFMKNPTARATTPEPEKEAPWNEELSDVVHLTDQTFNSTLQEHASVLIMFYAPWCGHCKNMKPEFVAAAAKMKSQSISGILAAVDSTVEKVVTNRFQIKGFPTVKYFRNSIYEFDVNERIADNIVDFMKNPQKPPPPPPPPKPWSEENTPVVHLTQLDFRSFLKKKKQVLVIFYAPWCGHCKSAKPHFVEAATKLKDNIKVALAAVDCTIEKSVCDEEDVKGFPTFVHYTFGKYAKKYQGPRNSDGFLTFLANPRSHNDEL